MQAKKQKNDDESPSEFYLVGSLSVNETNGQQIFLGNWGDSLSIATDRFTSPELRYRFRFEEEAHGTGKFIGWYTNSDEYQHRDEMTIQCHKSAKGFNVQGAGANEVGSYTVTGDLVEKGESAWRLELYRLYTSFTDGWDNSPAVSEGVLSIIDNTFESNVDSTMDVVKHTDSAGDDSDGVLPPVDSTFENNIAMDVIIKHSGNLIDDGKMILCGNELHLTYVPFCFLI